MTLSEELARRALTSPDPAGVERLRSLTLTNVAAAVGDLGAAQRLIETVPNQDGNPGAAAFRFGMRLHARTQDDFYPAGRVHVGAVTLAASLALADRSNRTLVACLAPGYETMCLVSSAYAADSQQRGFRPTGIFGPIGAAVSAATALGLDVDGVANAIGLAAARSGGTNQSWISGTDEWLIEVGAAARAGVEAALMTEAGVQASREALDGPAGWARAFFDDVGARRLEARLADDESLIERVAVKPFPVSGIAQVPTDLACRARERTGGDPSGPVLLRMSAEEFSYPGSGNRGPFRSRSDALMSVAFCVACGLTDGLIRLHRLEHPNELLTAIEGVQIEPDSDLADGEAMLRMTGSAELIGSRATLLFPTWDSLAAAADVLAERSEAPIDLVSRAVELLADADAGLSAVAEVLDLAA